MSWKAIRSDETGIKLLAKHHNIEGMEGKENIEDRLLVDKAHTTDPIVYKHDNPSF